MPEEEKSLPADLPAEVTSAQAGDGGTPFSKGRIKPLSTEPYKGVWDFYPEDMAVQNHIFSTWKKVCEEFGYKEYAASLLESAELYRSKGSEEIVNEQMFTFTDRGGREVALRPEMTPSLARMIAARRKSLKFPLRWYTIANCFRYERPQRGRKREHWQLNADLMGIAGIEAEVEIISLAYKIMKAFGAKDEDFEIRINTREGKMRIEKPKFHPLPIEITREQEIVLRRLKDRQDKISKEDFRKSVKEILGDSLKLELDEPVEVAYEKHKSIDLIISSLETQGVMNVRFDESLVRGFDYYTGIVFEVFDTHKENRRSLFGGGRYDNLLELFGADPVPTVGFGMGDVTIRDFLETHRLHPCKK